MGQKQFVPRTISVHLLLKVRKSGLNDNKNVSQLTMYKLLIVKGM